MWVGGFTQHEGKSYWQTYSATPMLESFLISVAVAAHLGWKPYGADCKQAFLQPSLPESMKSKLFGRLPSDLKVEGVCAGGELVEFMKPLYGAKASGRVFQQYANSIILGYDGMTQSKKDQSVFFLRENEVLKMILIVMIDDFLAFTDEATWNGFFEYLSTKLKVENAGEIKVWNGFEIETAEDGIKISQSKQVKKMLQEISTTYELKAEKTPEDKVSYEDLSKLYMQSDDLDSELVEEYQKLLGKICYVANKSRPDIAHAPGRAGQVAHAASERSMKGLVKIAGYLYKNSEKELCFRKDSSVCPAAFSDSNFANEELFPGKSDLGMKSTSGVAIFMSGASGSWIG